MGFLSSLCGSKGLHLAVFGWLAGPLMSRAYAVPAVAALWTGLERTHGTFGFAWLDLGNAGIDMSVPLRLAPFIGVYGISFVFAMLSVGSAALRCAVRGYGFCRSLAAAVALVTSRNPPRNARFARCAGGAAEYRSGYRMDQRTARADRTSAHHALECAARAASDLARIYLRRSISITIRCFMSRRGVARRHGYFLFGTVAFTGREQPLNSAVLLGPEGREAGRYDKIDLVPFGEFVPRAFWFVNRVTQETGDFVAGKDIKVLPAAGSGLACSSVTNPHFRIWCGNSQSKAQTFW